MRLLLLLVSSTLFIRCAAQKISEPIINQKTLEVWKMDENGCSNLRDVEMAKYIRDSVFYQGREESWVLNKLGNPDLKEADNWKYYFDTFCKDDVKVDSLDNCWLSIKLVDNKTKYVDIYCN